MTLSGCEVSGSGWRAARAETRNQDHRLASGSAAMLGLNYHFLSYSGDSVSPVLSSFVCEITIYYYAAQIVGHYQECDWPLVTLLSAHTIWEIVTEKKYRCRMTVTNNRHVVQSAHSIRRSPTWQRRRRRPTPSDERWNGPFSVLPSRPTLPVCIVLASRYSSRSQNTIQSHTCNNNSCGLGLLKAPRGQ